VGCVEDDAGDEKKTVNTLESIILAKLDSRIWKNMTTLSTPRTKKNLFVDTSAGKRDSIFGA